MPSSHPEKYVVVGSRRSSVAMVYHCIIVYHCYSKDTERGQKAMHIFAYLRVSTAEQASNGDSLATQRQQIAGYAMMRGWPEPKCFIDAGVSGSVPLAERPEGKGLLEAVEKGDVIITAKLDRAFRSASDALAHWRN